MGELNYKLVQGPIIEPISLAQAKLHLRRDDTFDDTLITALITTAREWCEHYTHRVFFNQTWMLSLDVFPFQYMSSTLPTRSHNNFDLYNSYFDMVAIRLPRPMCVAVDSITFLDLNTQVQTVPPANYFVDTSSEPARIVPFPSFFWPYSQTMLPGSVRVQFQAGSYVTPVIGESFTVPAKTPFTYTPLQPNVTAITSVTDANGNTPPFTFANGQLTFQAASAGLTYTLDYYIGNCPLSIQQAMLILIDHWYKNRSLLNEKTNYQVPLAVESLLSYYTFDAFTFSDA